MPRLASIIVLLSLTSCYFTKALKYKKYELTRINDFEADRYSPSNPQNPFHRGSISPSIRQELDSLLIGSNKYAFLVIRNDSILYEFYNQNIADTTLLPSFSVAKSFVSTMISMTHEDGKIKSLNEPITNYIPELKERDARFQNITIQHLLDMRSGIKSSENYFNPLSDVLRLGFGKNIRKKALHISIESPPNEKFEYKSINTQLLGLILEKATGQKLQDYYHQRIYTPLQMQYPATWMVDDPKHREARAFCCLNMTALDYAKFGKLFLDNGKWSDKQLVSPKWIAWTTNPDTMMRYEGYKNQWWQKTIVKKYSDTASLFRDIRHYKLNTKKRTVTLNDDGSYQGSLHIARGYYARGLLHQYIYILPERNLILVHFGNNRNPSNPLKKGFDQRIDELFVE